MKIKKMYSFPPCHKKTIQIQVLDSATNGVDLEPKEIQRGEVCSDGWSSDIIGSILSGVELQPLTWSVQEFTYDRDWKGCVIRVRIKNIDGLQRITSIQKFERGLINIPKGIISDWEHNQDFYGKKEIDLGGLSYLDFKTKYPELFQAKWKEYQLRIDEYGGNGTYLTKQQETYLFKQVLNNGNVMNGQQWRNPTVSKIAEVIRDDARLTPIPLFSSDITLNKKGNPIYNPNHLGFKNPKMEYDELNAMAYHFVKEGVIGTNGTKAGLDEMYDDPNLEDDLVCHSNTYGKKVNLQTEVNRLWGIVKNILEEGDMKDIVDKGLVKSCFYFAYENEKEYGRDTKWNIPKMSNTFFEGHLEMIDTSSLPKGTPRTVFGDALVSKGSSYTKIILSSWRDKLGLKEDPIYG